MTHYFFDSSALIKRYIPEQGTRWVRSLMIQTAANVCYIAHITPVEIVSALARRRREGYLSEKHARAIRVIVTQHAKKQYVGVNLSGPAIRRAMDLLEAFPLRAYDAIQLASALECSARLTAAGLTSLTFVSADKQLLKVAAAEGLIADNPENHP